MLENLAAHLTNIMIAKGAVPAEDAEIYNYGWALTLSNVGTFLVLFILGACLNQFLGTCLYLLGFILLRTYAGGYHANSYRACFLLTILFYMIALWLHFYCPPPYVDLLLALFLLLSLLITYRWAPVDHPNKPHNTATRRKNRKISRLLVSGESLLIMLLWLYQPGLSFYLLWVATGMALTSLTLLYVIYFPYAK